MLLRAMRQRRTPFAVAGHQAEVRVQSRRRLANDSVERARGWAVYSLAVLANLLGKKPWLLWPRLSPKTGRRVGRALVRA
jgi:hypothetical protein